MLLLARVAVATILAGQTVSAAPTAGAAAKEEKAKPAAGSTTAIDEFKADAKQYVMRLDAHPGRAFALAEEPLLHWGNPARTGEDGAVFVWLLDGRPQVIGSIFTYRLQNTIYRKHEYHSLAAGPITAVYQGRRVWAPRKAGVTFEPVPDDPAVPATPRARLSQMKTVARWFSAKIEEAHGKKDELRLLPQPLLHYESNDKKIDGALFSFSLGTDPEVILMLEADLDGRAWRYALARYHFVDLRVAYQGREVWHAEPMPDDISTLDIGTTKYQESVYATYHTVTTKIEE
ncbi:MAG TPA: hypothetical protein VHC22_16950 [Pirellulales bacterium]|nr:hypothetical protein [Pirellulales bacterium]